MSAKIRRTREDRRRTEEVSADPRSAYQRDRDRLLFSSELHRLAEITQVISPDGHTFHNRLTHTLEVAQIGQRMTQRLIKEMPYLRSEGLIDPDVVEAACLAHDLGHPPFGHVAETTLDELGKEYGGGGFEGNAQSFRIVTRLALHSARNEQQGLNLTAATLNAIQKYPWMRSPNDSGHSKFGAYQSDEEAFAFARGLMPEGSREKSLEAQIMDHADAIAYAVHDMIDFYRAGLLPLEDVCREGKSDSSLGVKLFVTKLKAVNRAGKLTQDVDMSLDDAVQKVTHLVRSQVNLQQAYGGDKSEQYQLKEIASRLINRYITAPRIVDDGNSGLRLHIPPEHLVEINFLKELIWHYIIDRPQLGTQQEGMRYIVKGLFDTYRTTIVKDGDKRIVPASFREEFEEIAGKSAQEYKTRQIRLAIDIVASLSDRQAERLFSRLRGTSLGRITDFIAG